MLRLRPLLVELKAAAVSVGRYYAFAGVPRPPKDPETGEQCRGKEKVNKSTSRLPSRSNTCRISIRFSNSLSTVIHKSPPHTTPGHYQALDGIGLIAIP